MSRQNAYQDVALARLHKQIDDAKARLEAITAALEHKTGNVMEDTLVAVEADGERDYWEGRLIELRSLASYYEGEERELMEGVQCGDKVKLRKPEDGAEIELRIADRVDLFPEDRVMSVSSPLGNAILGKQIGDRIAAQTPGGAQEYLLVDLARGM